MGALTDGRRDPQWKQQDGGGGQGAGILRAAGWQGLQEKEGPTVSTTLRADHGVRPREGHF